MTALHDGLDESRDGSGHLDDQTALPQPEPCQRCHGSGQVLISLCCGRGCATCPGEGMMQNVDCFSCHGAGHIPPAPT